MKSMLDNIEYNYVELEKNDLGAKYQVNIKVPMAIGWIERMKFITENNSERVAHQLHHLKNDNNFVYFSGEVFLPTCAIYNYYFSFEANHNFIYFKKENRDNYKSIAKNEMWKLSVNFIVPDWAKGKMMYHIFVDRFYRGSEDKLHELPNRIIHQSWDEDIPILLEGNYPNNDFYGGDLIGIRKKLPYIKSLGVSIIYLSPVCMSQSNHRYDTADYECVDPYAGSNEDLKLLCDAAHKLGMKVILDAVFNHTGNDSKYFNEFGNYPTIGAYQSKDSKYFPFYRKHYVDGKMYFDYWWGIKNEPVCDGTNKEWQDYIYGEGGIIDLWFSLGIDGLRLDVADELTDDFIYNIRKAVHRNKKDGFILGEVWDNPFRTKDMWGNYRHYISSGIGMDSVMNYQLAHAMIRYYKYGEYGLLNQILHEILNEYPNETINSLMNFTSTHDISRAINIFSTDEFKKYWKEWAWNVNNDDRNYQKEYRINKEDYQKGREIYLSYLMALAFLPGNMSIFYGDEIGMQGLGNLANRRPYTWDKIDYKILNHIKELGKIRNNEKFLETANLEIIDVNDKYFTYKRVLNNQESLVYVSRSGNREIIHVPSNYLDEKLLFNLNNSNKEELSPYGGIVLKKVR